MKQVIIADLVNGTCKLHLLSTRLAWLTRAPVLYDWINIFEAALEHVGKAREKQSGLFTVPDDKYQQEISQVTSKLAESDTSRSLE